MISSLQNYVRDTAYAFGESWNEFWLRPANPRPLAYLRIGVGLLLLYWFLTFFPDLTTLFGSNGLLTVDGVTQWERTVFAQRLPFSDAYRQGMGPSVNMSVLAFCESSTDLWVATSVAMLATISLVSGVYTRFSCVLTLVMFLSFVNRAPLLCGPFEAVAAMLLFYLALSPCGAVCSFDRWRQLRKSPPLESDPYARTLCHAPPRWSATVTQRLIQVHLCAIYLFMALAQWGGGGGETPWATGEAIWLLAARPTSGLGFGWLANAPVLIDFWTHGMWVFELIFPLLIWTKRVRPALLFLAGCVWLSFAMLTGMFAFCLLMIVAGLAFWPGASVSPQALRS
ncbi:MAG: hypothetical protein MPJ50_09620 [Pirellulales bacterium]|nr:hypothetical protein [Pirellulales bacterium]